MVTNNLKRRILSQYTIESYYSVIIHVPEQKIRKSEINVSRLKRIKNKLAYAHKLALRGNFQEALLLNGQVYGKAMGLDTSVMSRALAAGAVTAGITGTGPATVILAEPDKQDDIVSVIGPAFKLIITGLNRKKVNIRMDR